MNFQMIIDVAKLALKYPNYGDAFGNIIKDLANGDDMTPTPEECQIGITEGKLQMIKAYRTRTKLGLYEAKTNCEKYFEKQGHSFYYRNIY